ncbi:DUF4876 domain-containing protein [Culturomica massiliensis]|jgi:hypothetical protein|uniref:DUF4876 domain-containing protein n=1 Tax=Culturomica massiliensis TaxID=1841857 RepID=UPI00083962B3|nr:MULTISPECIES: DUF4876 domain-containing protein [Odoribacteraceae]RHV98034.1 DUF4876 domain-containing protein [Odoribacter sp. OF09-27XD]
MKTYYIFSILTLFLCTGCLKEEKIDTQIRIGIEFPEDFQHISRSGIPVKLYNTASGRYYTSVTNEEGIANLDVEYGFYDAIVQYQLTEEYNTYVFNGRYSDIVLAPGREDINDFYTVPLTYALKSNLIIREIYFGGCMTDDGITYSNDNYLAIYNNSEQIAYLDSICLGFVAPITSASKSNFVKPDGTLMDLLPVAMMAWQIPGSGTDYPLQPGEEVVIAVNAVNHKARHTESVDLSHVKFAFYNVNLSMQEAPAPGVISLNLIWKGPGEAYGLVPNGGPAMIMFKIPGNATDYASDASHLMQDPVTHTGLYHLMIDKEWVVDGIECIQSKSAVYKRLTSNVDAGFVCQEKLYSGLSVQRKVEKTADNGQIIYMDSNNSSEDVEVLPASLRNK